MQIQKYIITLSNKATIPVDEDEVPLVVEAIKKGQPGRVRQGIFNPSFFVSLTLDNSRIKQYLDEQPAWNSISKPKPIEQLPDIFAGQLPDGSKKLK